MSVSIWHNQLPTMLNDNTLVKGNFDTGPWGRMRCVFDENY